MRIDTIILIHKGNRFTVHIEPLASDRDVAAVGRMLATVSPEVTARPDFAETLSAWGRQRLPLLLAHFGGHHVAIHTHDERGADLGRVAVITSNTHPDWKL